MRKIILLIIMCIVFSSLVFALNFEQNKDIDLKIPCAFSGSRCSDAATCNITTRYSNGSYLINNQEMTNLLNGDFNYTLPNTKIRGTYSNRVFCMQGGFNDTTTFPFDITPTGTELSTSHGIVYVIVLILSLFTFVMLLFGAIKIPWKNGRNEDGRLIHINNLKWVKIIVCFFSYFALIWIFFLASTITGQFLFLDAASSFFNMIYLVLLSGTVILIPLTIFFTILIIIQDAKLRKQLERGLFER